MGTTAFRWCAVALAGATLALTACPRPRAAPRGDGTTVTVDGEPPPFPDGFDPGQPLPEPPPGDPAAVGASYLAMVYPPLRDAWGAFLEDCRLRLPPDHALNQPSLEATAELTVDADGQLVAVTLLRASGNADFDATVQEIAGGAGPFPAPPADVRSDDGRVYLTWLFARDRRQAGVATAALRRIEWPLPRAVPALLDAGELAEAARRLARASAGAAGAEQAEIAALTARVLVAALREALAAEDPEIQRVAIDGVIAAAAAGAGEALRPLARELRAIGDGAVELPLRGAALAALGAIGDRDAAPLLLAILDKDQGHNVELSGAAARALVALGQGAEVATRLRGWLASGERARLGGALWALARAAVPGLEAEVGKLVTHKDVAIRAAACAALGARLTAGGDATAWKALRKGLDDRDAQVRAACAAGAADAAAAGVKSRPAYWRLVELLRDKDERVRAGAVRAALLLEPVKVTQELTPLNKEKSAAVLAALATGLGARPGAVEPRLLKLAGHGDVGVRAAAVRALAARADAPSRAAAAAAIVDPEAAVRAAAVAALDDAAQLATLAEDPAPEVAAAARTRRVVLAGRAASLAEVALAVAGAPRASRDRALLAAAWLQAPAG